MRGVIVFGLITLAACSSSSSNGGETCSANQPCSASPRLYQSCCDPGGACFYRFADGEVFQTNKQVANYCQGMTATDARGSCLGGSVACATLTTSNDCSKVPGCLYSLAACTGPSASCTSPDTQVNCEAIPGCHWGGCHGTPSVSCASIVTPVECRATSPCMWL